MMSAGGASGTRGRPSRCAGRRLGRAEALGGFPWYTAMPARATPHSASPRPWPHSVQGVASRHDSGLSVHL